MFLLIGCCFVLCVISRCVATNFSILERSEIKRLPKWWMSQYVYNKTIPHGKGFVRCIRTRCFLIRNLTCSLRSLVRFLTRQQLVRKYRTPALPMKYPIYISSFHRASSRLLLYQRVPVDICVSLTLDIKSIKWTWTTFKQTSERMPDWILPIFSWHSGLSVLDTTPRPCRLRQRTQSSYL